MVTSQLLQKASKDVDPTLLDGRATERLFKQPDRSDGEHEETDASESEDRFSQGTVQHAKLHAKAHETFPVTRRKQLYVNSILAGRFSSIKNRSCYLGIAETFRAQTASQVSNADRRMIITRRQVSMVRLLLAISTLHIQFLVAVLLFVGFSWKFVQRGSWFRSVFR